MIDSKTLKTLGVVLVIIVVIAFAVMLLSKTPVTATSGTTSQTTITTTPAGTNQSSQSGSGTKLADTPYAQASNLVYSPSSTKVQYFAAGFNITTQTFVNGSVGITFHPLGGTGNSVLYTIPKNDSLYYIDTSLGDDSVPSGEYSLGDDGVVLVNSAGYVVSPIGSP